MAWREGNDTRPKLAQLNSGVGIGRTGPCLGGLLPRTVCINLHLTRRPMLPLSTKAQSRPVLIKIEKKCELLSSILGQFYLISKIFNFYNLHYKRIFLITSKESKCSIHTQVRLLPNLSHKSSYYVKFFQKFCIKLSTLALSNWSEDECLILNITTIKIERINCKN